MRQKAREFYEEAKLLASAKKFNGAASRLYYALYHIITAIFDEKGIKQSELTSKVDPKHPGHWLNEVVRYNSTLAGFTLDEADCVKLVWALRVQSDYSDEHVSEIKLFKLMSKTCTIMRRLGVAV